MTYLADVIDRLPIRSSSTRFGSRVSGPVVSLQLERNEVLPKRRSKIGILNLAMGIYLDPPPPLLIGR
jgi:hypothetical protein